MVNACVRSSDQSSDDGTHRVASTQSAPGANSPFDSCCSAEAILVRRFDGLPPAETLDRIAKATRNSCARCHPNLSIGSPEPEVLNLPLQTTP